MTEIKKSVIDTYSQIQKPEELTNAEKELFLKLDPQLFNQATFYELKNQITKKEHVAQKIKNIIDLEKEIMTLPDTNEGVQFLVDKVFEGKWVSEDIGRILIILKGEGYYNKKIDCTAGMGLLSAIKLFFRGEQQGESANKKPSKANIQKLQSLNISTESITNLSAESSLSENDIIALSSEFKELNDLVEGGNASESIINSKLAIITAKYGDKMGSFLDIASHPGMGCTPVLAFMKNPLARKALQGVSVAGGLGMRKNFLNAYEQGESLGGTVRNMGKYFIPFAGNYWDFEDGVRDINQGNTGMGCLNFASGIIGTGLDILSIFPPVAVVGQPAKVGTKMGIKGAVKMIGNGESMWKVGKHVAGVFTDTALSMKTGFLKFTDEISKMKKSPAYRKQVLSKIGNQMITRIDESLPMITKFEQYAKSLPFLLGKPLEIFIKSIKPVIYGGVDALRGMVDTMTFKNVRKGSKAANNINDASKSSDENATNKKVSPESIKVTKNGKVVEIINNKIQKNQNSGLPEVVAAYYSKETITKSDAINLQTYLRENGYYEPGENNKSDGAIGKASIKALENWRDDVQPSVEKDKSADYKEPDLSKLTIPKSLTEAISVMKNLVKTTSKKVSASAEAIISSKLEDIGASIRDNAMKWASGSGFKTLRDNLQDFAKNVQKNAKGILNEYEFVTLSGHKVGSTLGMFDIPYFRRKRNNEQPNNGNGNQSVLHQNRYEQVRNFSKLTLSNKSTVLLDASGNNGTLTITHGGHGYILRNGQEITLGRNFENNHFGFDMAVSRNHCRIRFQDGKIYVMDISSYGTRGEKVTESDSNQSNNFNQERRRKEREQEQERQRRENKERRRKEREEEQRKQEQERQRQEQERRRKEREQEQRKQEQERQRQEQERQRKEKERTRNPEHTKLLTQFAEMKTNHISTMKLENGHTLTFKKLSDSGDIKLIHSSKSDLTGLNQTGKILYTQSGPAFVYKLSGANKGINISEANFQSINSKTIYNLNYGDLNTMVTDLRGVVQKRESGDMGVNINESKKFIKLYEEKKIPESKKDNYEYHKNKYGEYLHEQGNLTYFTELLSNFN